MLVVFQLSACGDPDRYRTYPTVTGPSRIPLTEEPVRVDFNSSGIFTSPTVYVKLYGRDLNDVIATGVFPMDKASSQTIQGVKFDYVPAGNAGSMSFVMNRAQYAAIKSPLGSPLRNLHMDISATSNIEIKTFGDGVFAFNDAYHYGFSDSAAQPIRFPYTADPSRLASLVKTWKITSTFGQVVANFTEQCATYLDTGVGGDCTTDYANTSSYATSTTRAVPEGIYDVIVTTRDVVWGDAGVFGTKLIVSPRPVARIKAVEPSTATVGTTLAFDASDSVAGVGSTVVYTLAKPAGSNATLLNQNTRNPSLVADVRGTYAVTLTVTFNGVVSTATASRLVTPPVTGASGG